MPHLETCNTTPKTRRNNTSVDQAPCLRRRRRVRQRCWITGGLTTREPPCPSPAAKKIRTCTPIQNANTNLDVGHPLRIGSPLKAAPRLYMNVSHTCNYSMWSKRIKLASKNFILYYCVVFMDKAPPNRFKVNV